MMHKTNHIGSHPHCYNNSLNNDKLPGAKPVKQDNDYQAAHPLIILVNKF